MTCLIAQSSSCESWTPPPLVVNLVAKPVPERLNKLNKQMVVHQQPCPRHLTCVWLKIHQGSSYESYTLTPPGGEYGCQPVPERSLIHIYFYGGSPEHQSSPHQVHLILVLWEYTYSPPFPSRAGYVKLYAVWIFKPLHTHISGSLDQLNLVYIFSWSVWGF